MNLERQRLIKLRINLIIEMHNTGGIDIKTNDGDGIDTDLQYFRKKTTKGTPMSNAVIMGRITYETINKPLPNRHNIIISRTLDDIPGCKVRNTLDSAILTAIKTPGVEKIWICGGKSIYDLFLSRYRPNKIYVVLNHSKYESDFKTLIDYNNLIPTGNDFRYLNVANKNTYIEDMDDEDKQTHVHKKHMRLLREYNKYELKYEHKSDEQKYINMVRNVLGNGFYQLDRTGVGTLTIHGDMLRFSLRGNRLPVITGRRTFYRGAIEEFLWMLRGETDTTSLKNKNIHIWDGNTTKEFIKNRGLEHKVPENDIGALYGYQIRNWGGDWDKWITEGKRTGIDQLKRLIDNLKSNPNSRRHVISNYNISQLDMGVLEPCHTLYAFNIDTEKKELHSTLFMRSCDTCCGLVLNIIHISFLTHVLAKIITTPDVTYTAGDFVFMGNNVHLYLNHIHSFIMQSYRRCYEFPKINIKKEINTLHDIETLDYHNDIELIDYKCNKPLLYKMAI